jgi:ribosome-associated protein
VLEIDPRIRVPFRELEFRFDRSSGPGGQNVNKTNTKATLRFRVAASPSLPEDVKVRFLRLFASRVGRDGWLVLSSQRYRDQGRNVADCLEKLRAMLQAAARPPRRRRATRPTRPSVERRLRHKRERSASKHLRSKPRGDAD